MIPSYTAAALTDKMVWVVPTLAASSFFAATIGLSPQKLRRNLEEDGEVDPDTENVTEMLENPDEADTNGTESSD
ncbi:hypothetical protein [Pseudosulfitobacter sp. SM2401]|uniref:hypothetical protein n=1 Tax=Pseudosulfitobacter sp. SM2401 TaxID=3350098 RepID=UPI0036F1A647